MDCMSMIAFFHKHYQGNTRTRKSLATSKPRTVDYWDKCAKCEELFKKGTLLHDEATKLDFCEHCMGALKILRDV